jgi:hypothetical protein
MPMSGHRAAAERVTSAVGEPLIMSLKLANCFFLTLLTEIENDQGE